MICPHCKQPMGWAPADEQDLKKLLAALRLPGQEQRVLEALMDNYGRWITSEQLIRRVWTVFREPRDPYASLQSHVSKLRVKLMLFGWTIDSMRFTGYRLQRCED